MNSYIYKTIILFLFVTFITSACSNKNKTSPHAQISQPLQKQSAVIHYFGDPMCSWCYGLSPELTKLKSMFGDSVEWKLINGGLRPYNTQTMADLEGFLDSHWSEVSHRSGQAFNHSILKDHTFVYDTEPACRAVYTIQQIKPEKDFEYFKRIQTAFYKDNKRINNGSVLADLASEFGVDKHQFLTLFESDSAKAGVREQFQLTQSRGVNSFPTVLLQLDDTFHQIALGHSTAEKMSKRISNLINAQKQLESN